MFMYSNKYLSRYLTNISIPALRYLSLGSGQQDSMKEEQKSTSATAVYEVARPILQGCHAIPTKLKILLDRALSALSQEEVLMIVSGCGWQLDDYQRGYKLKVCCYSFALSRVIWLYSFSYLFFLEINSDPGQVFLIAGKRDFGSFSGQTVITVNH